MNTFTITETGECYHDPADHGLNRRRRWSRRTRARQIAYIHEPGQPSQGTSPLRRLKSCGLAKAPDVKIMYHNHHAFASGLVSCGNIWTCPTCSARIRARRETELENALARHTSRGGGIAMLTLTLRHDRTMALADTITRLNAAYDDLKKTTGWRYISKSFTGTIATLEVTHGANGWHPHLHVITLTRELTNEERIRNGLYALRTAWSRLANTRTDKHSIEHGLNVVWFGSATKAAAQYVTKLAKEITLADTKSGLDPFGLLDDTSPESTALFIEYALATYRRQCHRWSAGLKQLLAVDDLTDEELADDNDDVGIELLTLTREFWNSITETERLGWIEFAEAQHHFSGP